MIALSAENRTGASVAGGDEVDVDLELDTAPREIRAVTTLSLIGGVIAGERRQKETMPPSTGGSLDGPDGDEPTTT